MSAVGFPCPVCTCAAAAERLLSTPPLPRTGQLLDSGDASLPLRPLDFLFCPECGFVRQSPREAAALDYSTVSRATKQQTPGYIDAVLEQARRYCTKDSPRVVEIGCNDGALLDVAAQHGFVRLLGVEPSKFLADACAAAGHPTECTLFTLETALKLVQRGCQADVLFARHVLEHVPDPEDFLRGLRVLLAPGGVLFLECPDTREVLFGLHGYELWDEHLGYYTERTLKLLLARCGFQVLHLSTEPHRGTRNLLCWAVAAAGPAAASGDAEEELAACRSFAGRWSAFCSGLQEAAGRWPGPVAALGASHPQLNFLWYAGLADRVDFLVDDDPLKIGRYMQLARPVPVVSTARLFAGPGPGTLLCTAFGCDAWTSKVAGAFEGKGVLLMDPYLTGRG